MKYNLQNELAKVMLKLVCIFVFIFLKNKNLIRNIRGSVQRSVARYRCRCQEVAWSQYHSGVLLSLFGCKCSLLFFFLKKKQN